MPNSLTAQGLTLNTQAELVQLYTTAFQNIYGTDINLGPETPDGQLMMIFIQSVLDVQDLLMQVYNSFDPDNAVGVVLDQRVALNGIVRKSGTFTTTDITLVLSQSVNLYGVDQTVNPVYTVSDNAGNQWELLTTQLGTGPGSEVFLFQAATPGALTTTPNTITVPVTVVLGVTSINNPTTYATLGTNEESDAALKIRRQMSVSIPSQSFYNGLLAALENIDGVTFASIVENDTGTTNVDGVPGHSIWVIVAGTGAAASIANAIYTKRSAGCGIYNSGDSGAQSYSITQLDGSVFVVYWDTVIPENLFIKFTTTSLNGSTPPNIAAIRSGLPTSFVPGVNAQVNINELSSLVQGIDPNTLVTLAGFSTTYNGTYTNTLSPTNANYQFAVSSPNIIILPMQVSPSAATVVHGGTQQFLGLGGYGTYSYSLSVNNSGGSISGTGLYTAGSTHPVTDTVLVTDSLSNTATALVMVT
jgi:uncharacterized phage protein gp47/JayE